MFSYFKSAIDNIVKPASFFVIDEKRFTRDSKFSFKDYVTFFCVNKGTSNQADLEDFIEDDFTNNLETITRQALSKQRVFINPLVFKEISKEYLRLIGYNRNNHFFKEYKGFRLYGGDGSDFEIPDFEEVRRDFGIKDTPKYRKPAMAKFSSIMDLLNGFILDGIIGYFIVRLKDKSYIDERYTIKENDSEIKIKLTKDRIKKFHNPSLKEEYGKEEHLNLRILTIELDNGKTETLLTNIFNKEFQIEDFKELYNLRWGIETNYNTMKNRLNIENYSGKKRITIEQDIYSKFLKYNVFQHYENYFNLLINRTQRQKGKLGLFKVNQAHLIRKLKKYLPIMILNPTPEIIRTYTKNLIISCTKSPNKSTKKQTTKRNPKKQRKFNLNYRPT